MRMNKLKFKDRTTFLMVLHNQNQSHIGNKKKLSKQRWDQLPFGKLLNVRTYKS